MQRAYRRVPPRPAFCHHDNGCFRVCLSGKSLQDRQVVHRRVPWHCAHGFSHDHPIRSLLPYRMHVRPHFSNAPFTFFLRTRNTEYNSIKPELDPDLSIHFKFELVDIKTLLKNCQSNLFKTKP